MYFDTCGKQINFKYIIEELKIKAKKASLG